jgi:hypothetical protein
MWSREKQKVDSMQSSNHKSTGRLSPSLSISASFAIFGKKFSFILCVLASMNGFADARLRIVRANKTLMLMICLERNARRRHHNYMRLNVLHFSFFDRTSSSLLFFFAGSRIFANQIFELSS